jgi:enoyl-CoA hydratase
VPEILVEDANRIRTITLNRPEKLNAFTEAMTQSLYEALADTRRNKDISVIVIKGAGRAFSAGHDLQEAYTIEEPYAVPSMIGMERWHGFRQLNIWFDLMWEMPQPIIAQVHGYCFTYALELAMHADLVVAAEDATFIHRPIGGAGRHFHMLPWLMGPRKAKEYLLLGKGISGVEAERLDMVNRAVPAERLDAEVAELAGELARIPLELLSLEKKAVNSMLEAQNLRMALGYTMELHAMSHLTETSQELTGGMKDQGWKAAYDTRNEERFGGKRT